MTDFSSGSVISGGSGSATHSYHNGTETVAEDRSYTVTATVEDLAGLQDNATFQVDIVTVLPTASATCSPTALYANESISCAAESTAGTFSVDSLEVDWGDGSTHSTVTGASGTPTHTYATDGAFTIRVRSFDRRGNASPWTLINITVAPVVAPSNPIVTCSPNPVTVSQPTSCSVTATKETYDLESYEFSWDGDQVAEYSGLSSTQSHTYTTVGVKTVMARVRVWQETGALGPAQQLTSGMRQAVLQSPAFRVQHTL